jgi:hypothetical protein
MIFLFIFTYLDIERLVAIGLHSNLQLSVIAYGRRSCIVLATLLTFVHQ